MTTTCTIFTITPINAFKPYDIRSDVIISDGLNESKNIKINKLDFGDLELRLTNAKTKLDKPYETDRKRFIRFQRQFQMEDKLKNNIHAIYNTPNVTNAWLKAYELYNTYNEFIPNTDKIVHFDNAAFPGTFVLAAYQYYYTMTNIKNYDWYASSMIEPNNEKAIGLLVDKFNLYKNYKDRWLMIDINDLKLAINMGLLNADPPPLYTPSDSLIQFKNDGDVTVWENQLDFQRQLPNNVDLYTSDLGFDVSSDYSKQEEFHAFANLGQIISGLMTLKKGGLLITKQYTYFNQFTVTLIALLTKIFDRLDINKPMYSKTMNSEVYIVGVGYKGYNDSSGSVLDILSKRLKKWELTPLINQSDLTPKFIDDIIKSQTYFATAQINEIDNCIEEYNRIIRSNDQLINPKYISLRLKNIEQWKSVNKIRHLTKPPLNVIDTNRPDHFKKFDRKKYKGGNLDKMDWVKYLFIIILIILILIIGISTVSFYIAFKPIISNRGMINNLNANIH